MEKGQKISLEEIILQDSIWSVIGTKLFEIQNELDIELIHSNKPKSINWFYRVTSAKGGPKGQTKALFSEAEQQMCIPELFGAISSVSPITGQILERNFYRMCSLDCLPSAETVLFFNRSLSLSNDIVSKLQALKVDGQFLKEEYARGSLRITLSSPPFSFPFGISSKINSLVQEIIRDGQQFHFIDTKKKFSEEGLMNNPFVESMKIQNQIKSMLASTLLSQCEDVKLKKLVIRLMLALGENDAWLKFAKSKGATSGAEAERRISEAQASGEPESIVIPLIAKAPGYLAIDFLAELKIITGMHNAVEAIENHLMCVESATQNKGDRIAQVNSAIRQWIIDNELCDITSQAEIQARVDDLKDYQVASLDDLNNMDKEDFEKCGFKGIKAKKAYNASRK